MDVLLATFQGVTIEACSTGHVGQVKVFEQLSLLVRTLAAAPPEFIAQHRTYTEKALHNLVLGEFGSREGLMTGPFLELVRDAFTYLYTYSDSKDMLALAGEFQDAVSKNKRGITSSQAAACMYALSGISRSKGKNLAGHLSDTIQIAETTLTPRSKQTLMKLAQFAVSTLTNVTASSPALRVAVVEALVDGLIGAGEAGRREWPNALRVLSRASQVKSSLAVREIGVKGLCALARITPDPVDKLGVSIVAALNDSELSVRMLAAEALGTLIAFHRGAVQWSLASNLGAIEAGLIPKKVSLENVNSKTPMHDALEALVQAFHHSSSFEYKQALARAAAVLINVIPMPKSVDDVVVQIDFGLRFAASDIHPDKNENVACASYVLRAGIGSRVPERLQLASASRLANVASSGNERVGTRRTAFIELQHLVASLGEGATSLAESCFKAYESVPSDVVGLLAEACAVLRAVVLAVPESSSAVSIKLLEALIMNQADPINIERPVRALCAVIRAASSVNRGGALPSTHLFGMGKALASRHLDQDSDPLGLFGCAGWDLIESLLTLGPAFYSPHLMQLFALWQETLRSSKNESVLACSVHALSGLLRNANDDDIDLLSKATSSLLTTIPISFLSKKGVRLQAAVLDCWAKCAQTSEAMDPTLLLLALHHITTPDAKTSFLDIGGLLNPQDEVLEFDSESFRTLAGGRPVDPFLETHLFQVNTSATPLENRDCFDTCADLHALVGRRARSRPSLGQRLKAAGGAGGGSKSEAALPPADPRAIPFAQTWAQRAVDSSITFFANLFARGDAKVRLEALKALISKYGGIPLHSSAPMGSNSSPSNNSQTVTPLKAYNVAACLLACMRICGEDDYVDIEAREIEDWQTILRDFLLGFLASHQAGIRRAAAQALTIFALRLASQEILAALQMFLEGVLKNPQDDDHTNALKCGALLAAARMRREGKEAFQYSPSESCVYDACKHTSQPLRVWSLHSWNLIVSSTNPSDAIRFVRPTMALVNAHLLAEAGSQTHESTAAHTASLLCLARLCNGVISCLGPELSSDEERATKLFSVWDILRKSSSPDIQRQSVAFCELFALFHPKFIFEDTYKRAVVTANVLERLRAPREDLNSVFATSVTSVLRLCERDAGFVSNRARLFESLERCGRAHAANAYVAISPTLGSYALRFVWAKNEMSGAPSPACSNRWSYFYPPAREEQVCYVTAEIVRTGGPRAIIPWFEFCRDVSTGGLLLSSQSGAENADAATADEESAGQRVLDLTDREDEEELTMREPRWQTKTVALEGVHAVVRQARTYGAEHMDLRRARENTIDGQEPLVRRLEALLSCAGQAATATVGEIGVMTLQARGLACLSRIVTIFAPQNDPDVPEFPLLRQYEAQLNATLRPGLSSRAQPELAREATVLAANVLITGVSTSARRVVSQLVIEDLLEKEAKEEDDDEDVFKVVDHEEEDGADAEGKNAFLTVRPEQSAFGTVVDDVSSSGLLLAKCCALARLALCAAGHAAAAFEDDVVPSDQVFRDDAKTAVAKALVHKTHQALVKVWIRIVRDYFVLQISSTLKAPKRHPDATYESGKTLQDVAALLPSYAEAWPVCAQAAADAVDSEYWSLPESSFQLLVFGCARALEAEDTSLRAIDTLTTLISKPSWSKLDRTFEKELVEVLALRAQKASQRGKKQVKEACFKCLSALLERSGPVLLGKGGDTANRLWARMFETCVVAAGNRSEALEKSGLGSACPVSLVPAALHALLYGGSKRGEPLDSIAKAAERLIRKDTAEVYRATVSEMIEKVEEASAVVAVAALSASTKLSRQSHETLIRKLLNDVLTRKEDEALATSIENRRALIRVVNDMFRRGHVEQARYYGRKLSFGGIFEFVHEDRDSVDTLKGVLEFWARICVMGGVETDGLIALAKMLAEDRNQAQPDERRVAAWGKFFLLVARENQAALRSLVAGVDPSTRSVLEETVRSAMQRA